MTDKSPNESRASLAGERRTRARLESASIAVRTREPAINARTPRRPRADLRTPAELTSTAVSSIDSADGWRGGGPSVEKRYRPAIQAGRAKSRGLKFF